MRFDKALADSTIQRYNALKGLDGIEAGSLLRYTGNGRSILQRVSKGHGKSDVSYGMRTCKDIVMVVNALIDQHYFDTPFPELVK
jgi:hypothetical protein